MMELRSELGLYPSNAEDDADGDQLIMEPRSERYSMRFGKEPIRYSSNEDDAV